MRAPNISPVSPCFMFRTAAMAENTSGAPFPKANKVMPCLVAKEKSLDMLIVEENEMKKSPKGYCYVVTHPQHFCYDDKRGTKAEK